MHGREVRNAKGKHLACMVELIKRLSDAFGIKQRVRLVKQHRIEMVGAKPLKRFVGRLDNMLIGEVVPLSIRLIMDSCLGLDKDLIP